MKNRRMEEGKGKERKRKNNKKVERILDFHS